MYLSSVRFDRKRRARSAAPTSLIIKRQQHPFCEKTDAKPTLMGSLEMTAGIILMESGVVGLVQLIYRLHRGLSSHDLRVRVLLFLRFDAEYFGKLI